MGGAPKWDTKLNIRDSQWATKRAYDAMMFWFTVFAAPCVALGAYTSLFIGDAKLAPIPEGYEPQEYEYERNPITR